MKKFKYFSISYLRPETDVRDFHKFCIVQRYYYQGYTNTFGYVCPKCFRNGHSSCPSCEGRVKILDRGPVVKEYIRYRREYRAARKYWDFIRSVWDNIEPTLTDDQKEALTIFGMHR